MVEVKRQSIETFWVGKGWPESMTCIIWQFDLMTFTWWTHGWGEGLNAYVIREGGERLL